MHSPIDFDAIVFWFSRGQTYRKLGINPSEVFYTGIEDVLHQAFMAGYRRGTQHVPAWPC